MSSSLVFVAGLFIFNVTRHSSSSCHGSITVQRQLCSALDDRALVLPDDVYGEQYLDECLAVGPDSFMVTLTSDSEHHHVPLTFVGNCTYNGVFDVQSSTPNGNVSVFLFAEHTFAEYDAVQEKSRTKRLPLRGQARALVDGMVIATSTSVREASPLPICSGRMTDVSHRHGFFSAVAPQSRPVPFVGFEVAATPWRYQYPHCRWRHLLSDEVRRCFQSPLRRWLFVGDSHAGAVLEMIIAEASGSSLVWPRPHATSAFVFELDTAALLKGSSPVFFYSQPMMNVTDLRYRLEQFAPTDVVLTFGHHFSHKHFTLRQFRPVLAATLDVLNEYADRASGAISTTYLTSPSYPFEGEAGASGGTVEWRTTPRMALFRSTALEILRTHAKKWTQRSPLRVIDLFAMQVALVNRTKDACHMGATIGANVVSAIFGDSENLCDATAAPGASQFVAANEAATALHVAGWPSARSWWPLNLNCTAESLSADVSPNGLCLVGRCVDLQGHAHLVLHALSWFDNVCDFSSVATDYVLKNGRTRVDLYGNDYGAVNFAIRGWQSLVF
jgi:hypothetical protein